MHQHRGLWQLWVLLQQLLVRVKEGVQDLHAAEARRDQDMMALLHMTRT